MATFGIFDIGDGIRLTATFSDLSGIVTDPSVVTFKMLDPLGDLTTPAVHNVTVGVYYADFLAATKGTHSFRWEATGAVTAAEEGQFTVRASFFIG